MAIFKAKVESNYTVIPNKTAQDLTVSFEARGMLALMLSLPDDWEIHKSWLLNQSPKCGRDKLTRIMSELQSAGYVVKKIKQSTDGKMDGVDWFVYSTVQLENRTTENPCNGKPDTTKETVLQKKDINKGASDIPKEEDKFDYTRIAQIFNKYFCRGEDPITRETLLSSEIKQLTPKRKKLIDSFFNQTKLTIETFEFYIEYVATDQNWLYLRKKNGKYSQRPFEYYMKLDCYVKASEENENNE